MAAGADVSATGEDELVASDQPDVCVELSVRLDQGPDTGRVVTITTAGDVVGTGVGDAVVLYRGDASVPIEQRYQFVEVQRGAPLVLLAGLLAAAVIGLGRLRGLLALAGLGVSVLVLVLFLVPALLDGRPPLLTAIVGASAVMIAVLLLAHGPSVRTATAVVGTGLSLLLIIALSTAFVRLAGLTGLSSEEAFHVGSLFEKVDVRGLLLAGIVIGALGSWTTSRSPRCPPCGSCGRRTSRCPHDSCTPPPYGSAETTSPRP